MKYTVVAISLVLAACSSTAEREVERPAPAQPVTQPPPQIVPQRPLPPPLDVPMDFRDAVQAGTRTTTGAPGQRYWVNAAAYRINARVTPNTKRVEGTTEITYRNHSPDTLTNLHVDLTQNFHRGDAIRFENAEVTGGVELRRVAVGGQALTTAGNGPRYQVFDTRLVILPPRPVLPGDTVNLAIDFAFTIPQRGAGERMGWNDNNLIFLAYWYPQMTVYDDVIGWHPDPFVGTTEFYADHSSYNVTIEAPDDWIVYGTGRLTNAEQALSATTLERLRRAEQSDQIVNVVTAADFATATRQTPNNVLRWNFVADSMRDVTYSFTRQSLWDATRTPVGDRNGDGQPDYALINAFYRQSAPLWRNAARYSQHSIAFLSRYLAMPYPWPHMTAVEGGGIIGGGMEFPMMTLIGDYNERGDEALYGVVAHELAHMWFPMLVSSDERRYSWMDEGTTTFNENQARNDFYPGKNANLDDQNQYLSVARAGMEGEIMRRSQYHYTPIAYGTASYSKPATMLVALRGLLGVDVFNRGLQLYGQRWKYRHPYPYDMWNTFENVSGRDLDWFWSTWYYTTWTLDQAVAGVTSTANGATIVIEDRGRAPMPVRLVVTTQSGDTIRQEVPVETWLRGATRTTVNVTTTSQVTRVEIDPERVFPDIDRTNNVWTRGQ